MKKLAGDAAWLDGINAAKTDIELRSRITPSKAAEVLLRSGSDAMVSRRPYDESQLIVVANGSFLLNLPLVNHEHRKAGGQADRRHRPAPQNRGVSGERRRRAAHPRQGPRRRQGATGWEVFNLWPTNWILCTWPPVGILFCFSRWPIFGRAAGTETESGADFGRHIDALAEMLKRSRDRGVRDVADS